MKKTRKIKRTEYEQLKKDYLTKNRSLRSLYVKLNRKKYVDKTLFMKLINKIRIEEGYPNTNPAKNQSKNIINIVIL